MIALDGRIVSATSACTKQQGGHYQSDMEQFHAPMIGRARSTASPGCSRPLWPTRSARRPIGLQGHDTTQAGNRPSRKGRKPGQSGEHPAVRAVGCPQERIPTRSDCLVCQAICRSEASSIWARMADRTPPDMRLALCSPPSRPLRAAARWPSASHDRSCAQCRGMIRPGQETALSRTKKRHCLPARPDARPAGASQAG